MDGENGREIPLRGGRAGDIKYAESLQQVVSVDWTFDPVGKNQKPPVTRLGGTAFPVTWKDAEPNEMVREYLRVREGSKTTQKQK